MMMMMIRSLVRQRDSGIKEVSFVFVFVFVFQPFRNLLLLGLDRFRHFEIGKNYINIYRRL